MVDEIYSRLCALLTGSEVFLNLGIVIFGFLGVGVWQHRESSRRGCLFVLHLAAAIAALGLIFTPFSKIVVQGFLGPTGHDPSFWQRLCFLGLLAPCLYALIAALHSKKAIREFVADAGEQKMRG